MIVIRSKTAEQESCRRDANIQQGQTHKASALVAKLLHVREQKGIQQLCTCQDFWEQQTSFSPHILPAWLCLAENASRCWPGIMYRNQHHNLAVLLHLPPVPSRCSTPLMAVLLLQATGCTPAMQPPAVSSPTPAHTPPNPHKKPLPTLESTPQHQHNTPT